MSLKDSQLKLKGGGDTTARGRDAGVGEPTSSSPSSELSSRSSSAVVVVVRREFTPAELMGYKLLFGAISCSAPLPSESIHLHRRA